MKNRFLACNAASPEHFSVWHWKRSSCGWNSPVSNQYRWWRTRTVGPRRVTGFATMNAFRRRRSLSDDSDRGPSSRRARTAAVVCKVNVINCQLGRSRSKVSRTLASKCLPFGKTPRFRRRMSRSLWSWPSVRYWMALETGHRLPRRFAEADMCCLVAVGDLWTWNAKKFNIDASPSAIRSLPYAYNLINDLIN